jgi:hypothetical protein
MKFGVRRNVYVKESNGHEHTLVLISTWYNRPYDFGFEKNCTIQKTKYDVTAFMDIFDDLTKDPEADEIELIDDVNKWSLTWSKE